MQNSSKDSNASITHTNTNQRVIHLFSLMSFVVNIRFFASIGQPNILILFANHFGIHRFLRIEIIPTFQIPQINQIPLIATVCTKIPEKNPTIYRTGIINHFCEWKKKNSSIPPRTEEKTPGKITAQNEW